VLKGGQNCEVDCWGMGGLIATKLLLHSLSTQKISSIYYPKEKNYLEVCSCDLSLDAIIIKKKLNNEYKFRGDLQHHKHFF
jgi:hypothetical protein